VIDSLPDTFYIFDPESGKGIQWNKTLNEISGYNYEEMNEYPPLHFYPPEEHQFIEEVVKTTSEKGRGTVELNYIIAYGTRIPFEYATVLIKNAEGKPCICAIGRDITERKAAEEELRQYTATLEAANKELEAFSYSVSHDLRTPLRAIDGFSQILLEDHREKLDKEGRRVLDTIRDNTGRMAELISDLLTFSRLGRKEIRKTRINMEKLARAVFKELRSATPRGKIEMKINALPSAFGDEGLVREVLTNFISNAIKFSKNEKVPVIEVGGKVEDKENIYYVKDSGVGFDMKYSDKLFGVFQRLHSQEEFKGTGVGLAIVQRIVHRHGGRVWAEGEVNKGATFYFTLPRKGEMTT